MPICKIKKEQKVNNGERIVKLISSNKGGSRAELAIIDTGKKPNESRTVHAQKIGVQKSGSNTKFVYVDKRGDKYTI